MSMQYNALEKIGNRYVTLARVNDLLKWDFDVMMPKGGSKTRGEQVAVITETLQNIIKSKEIANMVAGAEGEQLSEMQCRNLNYIKQLNAEANFIPEELQHKLCNAGIEGSSNWEKAKHAQDFKIWQPSLNSMVELTREFAKRKADFYGIDPYDGLVDIYDKGNTRQQIDVIFADIEHFITQNLSKAIATYEQKKIDIDTAMPIASQQQIIKEVVEILGFDLNAGRIDISSHPFCSGMADDTRITTRYDAENFLSALTAAIHESGHAIYAQNIANDIAGQPIGHYGNMTIHESQSLFYEKQIGHSRHFVEFVTPIINKITNKNFDSAGIYRTLNKVNIEFIRVEANEFIYPLHIIHRYKLEKALIDGSLKVADLPAAWDDEFQKLFGVKPPSVALGCLQDPHWALGHFGYFPCYLLGSVLASQVAHAAKGELGLFANNLDVKQLGNLKNWLNTKIHQFGGAYRADEVAQHIGYDNISAKIFLNYLESKFLS